MWLLTLKRLQETKSFREDLFLLSVKQEIALQWVVSREFSLLDPKSNVITISSIIRWLRLGNFLMIFNVLFDFNKHSSRLIVNILSQSILWLTAGVVIIACTYGSKPFIRIVIWWSIAAVLYLSFMSRTLILFYILFELRLIPIVLLLLIKGEQPERLSAGAYFILYTTILSIPYLVFILLLTPYLRFKSEITVMIRSVFRIILLTPFLVKIPAFGIHFWLPKAHVEASTSGSIVLAGILLKLGRYGAARISILTKIDSRISWSCGVWIILATMARITTFVQSDIRKYIAYRRVTHMTFMIVSLIANRKLLLIVVIILSLAHGWASIGIFKRGGIIRHKVGSRLGFLINLELNQIWVLILLGLILISNASIPPIPSFFPEIGILFRITFNRIPILYIFIILRFTVSYYNAYLYLWMSHYKRYSSVSLTISIAEIIGSAMLVLITFISVFWLFRF